MAFLTTPDAGPGNGHGAQPFVITAGGSSSWRSTAAATRPLLCRSARRNRAGGRGRDRAVPRALRHRPCSAGRVASDTTSVFVRRGQEHQHGGPVRGGGWRSGLRRADSVDLGLRCSQSRSRSCHAIATGTYLRGARHARALASHHPRISLLVAGLRRQGLDALLRNRGHPAGRSIRRQRHTQGHGSPVAGGRGDEAVAAGVLRAAGRAVRGWWRAASRGRRQV